MVLGELDGRGEARGELAEASLVELDAHGAELGRDVHGRHRGDPL
jgi:hypothetical protein